MRQVGKGKRCGHQGEAKGKKHRPAMFTFLLLVWLLSAVLIVGHLTSVVLTYVPLGQPL